jgi:hypothetical protein
VDGLTPGILTSGIFALGTRISLRNDFTSTFCN